MSAAKHSQISLSRRAIAAATLGLTLTTSAAGAASAAPTPAPTAECPRGSYQVTGERANIRTGPATKYKTNGYVIAGDCLEYVNWKTDANGRDWIYAVSLNGKYLGKNVGWISTANLEPAGYGILCGYQVAGKKANIRTGPATKYKTNGYVVGGDYLESAVSITDSNGREWIYATWLNDHDLAKNRGWISTANLEFQGCTSLS